MLKVYLSKKAAIRAAIRAYGEQWDKQARYLEIALPEQEFLYCIQARGKPASSRASARAARLSANARIERPSGAITGRCWDIYDLMKDKPRHEMIAEAAKQGINAGTAAAQYTRWSAARKR